jgi:hypothetical protein
MPSGLSLGAAPTTGPTGIDHGVSGGPITDAPVLVTGA